MSRLLDSGEFLIEHEPESVCELCKKKAETRPYGPNGENVCYDCGMKDEAAARRQMDKRLNAVKAVVVSREVLAEQLAEALRN